jgi:hypothetical protein
MRLKLGATGCFWLRLSGDDTAANISSRDRSQIDVVSICCFAAFAAEQVLKQPSWLGRESQKSRDETLTAGSLTPTQKKF